MSYGLCLACYTGSVAVNISARSLHRYVVAVDREKPEKTLKAWSPFCSLNSPQQRLCISSWSSNMHMVEMCSPEWHPLVFSSDWHWRRNLETLEYLWLNTSFKQIEGAVRLTLHKVYFSIIFNHDHEVFIGVGKHNHLTCPNIYLCIICAWFACRSLWVNMQCLKLTWKCINIKGTWIQRMTYFRESSAYTIPCFGYQRGILLQSEPAFSNYH